MGGIDRTRGECAAKRRTAGVSHWGSDDIAGDGVANAERRAVDDVDRRRVKTASAHPMGEGVVPFCLESLSAQDHVDSGDETPWSGLRLSQIGEADYDDNDMWLDGVEYAEPRPPKKPGGWMTDRRQLSLVLSLVLFLVLECGDGTTTVSTQSPGLCPEPMVSVCGGVMLWCFGGLVSPHT